MAAGSAQAAVRGTAQILEKALDGGRIDDAEALSLLESRDLVAVGRAANALRARRTDPDRITLAKFCPSCRKHTEHRETR